MHTQLIQREWEMFVKGNNEQFNHIRPVTVQAWKRCREAGVDANTSVTRILSEPELQKRRTVNEDLITAARPYMEQLSSTIGNRPHIIALLDKDAWVIEAIERDFGGLEKGMGAGACWAEKVIGNNAGGTSLILGKPVLIFGAEHYVKDHHNASCIGVPIMYRGKVIGSLDFSVFNEDADPNRLSLTQACVSSIERTLELWDTAQNHNASELPSSLAALVHDIKNPLTAIRALVQLSRMVESGKYLAKAEEQIDELVRSLDIWATALGKCGKRPLPIDTVINEVLDSVMPQCELQGIQVESCLHSQAVVLIDRELFKRALFNMVSNAIKAMRGGGKLTVRTESRGKAVLVAVEDTGCGIPEDIQERIFEPFVDSESGVGLGLYIVYNTIVEKFGGKLWFETGEQGTIFYVELKAWTG